MATNFHTMLWGTFFKRQRRANRADARRCKDSETVCASHRNTRIQNNEALRRLLEEGREVWGMPSEHQVQIHRMLRARATLQEGKGRKRVQGYALRWYKH
jgi:hypothetical protein